MKTSLQIALLLFAPALMAQNYLSKSITEIKESVTLPIILEKENLIVWQEPEAQRVLIFKNNKVVLEKVIPKEKKLLEAKYNELYNRKSKNVWKHHNAFCVTQNEAYVWTLIN